jgi:hypothetical protein
MRGTDGGRIVRHCRDLDRRSLTSNDGYLLQYFREGGVPILGVEPAANVASVWQSARDPTLTVLP